MAVPFALSQVPVASEARADVAKPIESIAAKDDFNKGAFMVPPKTLKLANNGFTLS
ncbi:hypothetical protein [Pseudovibrio sp. Alg231-02]|uniref:hypothetical protein n=1 Tax=Pseudovibrio sp. Alg231-02 TaxID=1922223 RepID=UPI001FCBA990|nr:hypothetical protein [Pseudovibrio sp. Alg231-02]